LIAARILGKIAHGLEEKTGASKKVKRNNIGKINLGKEE